MRHVWAVHVLKDAGATFAEAVFGDLMQAEDYAGARSEDTGVRGTAITRFTVGELGSRSTISWFVDGASCDGRILAARAKKKVGVPGWSTPAG
jgi:hypothetical protein